MDSLRTVIRVVGVAGLLGILVVSLLGGGGAPLAKGTQAPVTQGRTLDGGAFDLAAWRGQTTVVNLWATWCAPCLHEMPDFVDASRRHPDVRFVGLAVESKAVDIERVVARLSVPYPVVPIDEPTQAAWGASALPSTYIVAPDGTISWSVRGGITGDDLDAVLARQVR